jgi:methionine sulfoxide reductase catalytic subunit
LVDEFNLPQTSSRNTSMLIRRRKGWELPESLATDEYVALNRRAFVTGAASLGSGLIGGAAWAQTPASPIADLFPAKKNPAFTLDRPLTEESVASNYNNFYEFGPTKKIASAAQALKTRPWTVKIDGLVEKPLELDIDALIRSMPMEERLYRFRCVEAWAMAVPWTGFPLRALLAQAKPLSGAKYLRMETFLDPKTAPGQKQSWYPWPYVEGVTIEEAANDLALMVTGVYGKPLPNQFGAPIRLILPWKYGFKSIKSITRISFVAERPKSYWEALQSVEYGFWANVNPAVPHPRWSQASEEMIGAGERRPSVIYNGYGEFVAGMYAGKEKERLFV